MTETIFELQNRMVRTGRGAIHTLERRYEFNSAAGTLSMTENGVERGN